MHDPRLCDPSVLKSILTPLGFHFSKALGQNFLINPAVPERIAAQVPDDGWGVVEIGPGAGCLTYELSRRAGRVASLELDRRLIPLLRDTFAEAGNVTIVEGDVLKNDLRAFADEYLSGSEHLAACANLPYYITSPAIAALLEAERFEFVAVMVQKEVARRICASPDTSDYGAFTLFCRYYSVPKTLFDVGHGSFMPPPKVDSAVVRLDARAERPVPPELKETYFKTVKAAFGQRRKTLYNALSQAFGRERAGEALERAGIDPRRRGETLSDAEFARAAAFLNENLTSGD